jgi:hypothetical protein
VDRRGALRIGLPCRASPSLLERGGTVATEPGDVVRVASIDAIGSITRMRRIAG